MRLILPPLVLLAACVTPVTHRASGPMAPAAHSVDALGERINAIVAAQAGAYAGIYYHDLSRPESLLVNADVSFHAASTMKVPVMIELFRRVDSRTLSLDQTVVIKNSFRSLADGSPFTLDSSDDSERSLYRRIGGFATIGELDELMIEHSSNFATNLMLGILDAKAVTATARALGARNIHVLRGVEDDKAFAMGLNNTTTARDLAVLLTGIERGTVASRGSCTKMKEILLRQEFSTEIPAGLPPGVRVAHKTGWITGTLHDAAIVYPKNHPPYVLVVLTRNIADRSAARAMIAKVSREVYEFDVSQR